MMIKKEREKGDLVVIIGVRIMRMKEKKSEVNMGTNLNVYPSIIPIRIKATQVAFCLI